MGVLCRTAVRYPVASAEPFAQVALTEDDARTGHCAEGLADGLVARARTGQGDRHIGLQDQARRDYLAQHADVVPAQPDDAQPT